MHKKSFSLLQGGQSSHYRNQRFWKYIFPFIVVSYLTGKVLHTRKNLILLNDILNWIYLQITAQGSFLHKSIHGDTTAQTFYLFWSSWRHLSPSPLKYFIIQTAQGPFFVFFSPQLPPYIFPPILTGTLRGQLYIAFQVETYIILILLIKKT